MAVLRTSKDVSHLGGVPVGSTGTGRNSTTGQTVGDGLKGGGTGGLNLPDHTDHRVVESLSRLSVRTNHQGRSVVGISTSTKTNSSGLRSGECGLGSLRDQFSFALRYQGQIPTVNRSTLGQSQQTKLTPEFWRRSRNSAFRLRRSSLATTRVALDRLHSSRAALS